MARIEIVDLDDAQQLLKSPEAKTGKRRASATAVRGVSAGEPGGGDLERRLWAVADQLRANSSLRSSEYSLPVLGLIFLRYADFKFAVAEKELAGAATGRRQIGKIDYQALGVMYVPEQARFSRLLALPEGANLGRAINDAMAAIEDENDDLRGVLPQTYMEIPNSTLVELLKLLDSVPVDVEGDVFGKIYEYFLGSFAMSEGQRGGEFFTPISLVKLIVEILQPFHGRILDPATGSAGMFVQSAEFVKAHRGNPAGIMAYGQERTAETIRLGKMNLAIHGLSGDIRQGNTYYEDLHHATGKFDFVMANPPFNVNGIDRERIAADTARFPFGMPSVDNGNYIWIELFYSALNEHGRAGFVMANSAGDARGSELEIRRKLLEAHAVDAIVSIGPNFFYTVTLPCTLWFLDRGKQGTPRQDTVLFIDARSMYRQVDRAHREFTPAQIELLGNIARLYRGEASETDDASGDLMDQHFPDGRYRDVPGLCKVATLDEIAAQGWSLNPGRYVGVADRAPDEFVFAERLEELNEELERLNAEAHELEERIGENVVALLSRVS